MKSLKTIILTFACIIALAGLRAALGRESHNHTKSLESLGRRTRSPEIRNPADSHDLRLQEVGTPPIEECPETLFVATEITDFEECDISLLRGELKRATGEFNGGAYLL
jgi:hypothetical protein